MDNPFPSRKEILESRSNIKLPSYQQSIVDEIKSIDVDKVDFTNGDFKPRTKIVEKQRVFIWIRLYLKEENTDIKPNDEVKIRYIHTGEELETTFICYSKRGLDKDSDGNIVNYNTEDDKKVLCLMVDSDRIGPNSDDIPFIRTLFKGGKYYEFQLLKRDELQFINTSNNQLLDYFDFSF